MALEIERKFLVTDSSFRDLAFRKLYIVQGYLSRDPERVVRVRIKDDRAMLTIKGRNEGAVRCEFEYEIPMSDARAMLSLCEGTVVRKNRYLVKYEGFVWEVDEFDAPAGAPTIAEIELPFADTPFSRPSFVGEEVTGDERYYNSNL